MLRFLDCLSILKGVVVYKITCIYLLGSILTQAINFITNIYIIKSFSVNGYGVIAFVIEVTTFFIMLGESGYKSFFIKKIKDRNRYSIRVFQITNAIVIFLISLCFFYTKLGPVGIIFSLGLMMYLLTIPLQSQFIYHGDKYKVILKDLSISVLRFLGIFLCVNISLNVNLLFTFWCFPLIVVSYVYVRKDIYINLYKYFKRLFLNLKLTVNIFSQAVPYILTSIVNNVYNRLPVFYLGNFLGSSSVAYYMSATKFVFPSMFLITALVNAVIPKISNKKVFKFNWRFFLISFIPSLVLYLLIVLVSPYIIKFLFDGKYNQSIGLIRVLANYVLIVFNYSIISNYLSVNGYQKLIFIVNFCALFLLVILMLLIRTSSVLDVCILFIITELGVLLCYFFIVNILMKEVVWLYLIPVFFVSYNILSYIGLVRVIV